MLLFKNMHKSLSKENYLINTQSGEKINLFIRPLG